MTKLSAAGERALQIRTPGAVRTVAVDPAGHVYIGVPGFLCKFDIDLQTMLRKEVAGTITGPSVDRDGALHIAIARTDGQGVAAKLGAEGNASISLSSVHGPCCGLVG